MASNILEFTIFTPAILWPKRLVPRAFGLGCRGSVLVDVVFELPLAYQPFLHISMSLPQSVVMEQQGDDIASLSIPIS